MIESTVGRIADALERIAARLENQAPVEHTPPTKAVDLLDPPKAKPAKAAKLAAVEAEPAAPAPELTLDVLRKHLAPLDPAAGRALLQQFQVAKVSELQPEQYADVLAAVRVA